MPATALFDRIPANSEYYVDAQFYRGIAFVRQRRARNAIEAFTNIKNIIEEGDAVGVDDEARMLNLAKLSLARVYYAAANRIDPVSREYTVAPELRGQLKAETKATRDATAERNRERQRALRARLESLGESAP